MNHVSIRKIIDNETVNTTATVESKALLVNNGQDFGLIVIISGSGPDVKATYQVIASKQMDMNLVGSVKVGEGELTWITPATESVIIASITANAADGFAPMATPVFRIQMTGIAANGANTKVTVYLTQNDRI